MALKLIKNKIVGKIDDLDKKLNGEIPVNILELITLVNSWGREYDMNTIDDNIEIKKCKPKECYNLSKLDTSLITNMSFLFASSTFNGDISNWNTSKVTNMYGMFAKAFYFNSELNFDTSKVTNMYKMFFFAESFNETINFDFTNVINMDSILDNAIAFEKKFNNMQSLPHDTKNLKDWFYNNKDKLLSINKNFNEEVLDYFEFNK